MNAQKKQKNDKDKILCIVLYENFKFWFKNNNPNVKIPSSKDFIKCIKKNIIIKSKVRVGEKTQAGIEGYKILE
jgi:hypothetical protein